MIDRATIDRIMAAADIVDVVSEFVSLRKAGVNYKGLCPFHDEKTPSFVVSPAKGYCHCFSCGKGGNAVGFIMEHEQMTYPEALRWLARKYNIEIRERELTDDERREAGERESMFIVNEWALGYFQENLINTGNGLSVGMQYLRSRGFRDDTISKFQLGYALPVRDALARAAVSRGFKEQYLVDTGLCYRRDDGSLQDRYAGRVIFPVHTMTGRVVAFGGRILTSDKKAAKYVNSPESQIYHKGGELYGLYQARQAITRADRCYLVEGYVDVTSMHQCGVENVVASSGTSLTTGQIRLIRRFTSNITVLYDGDPAGIHASMRGIDMLLAEGMNVKVLLLPDGDDPDSFARKHNATDYQAYINAHEVDFIRFKTNLLLEEAGKDPIKRAGLISSIVKSISVIPDAIVRSVYIRECSQLLQMEEKILVEATAKLIEQARETKFKEEQRKREREQRNALSPAGETRQSQPAGTLPPSDASTPVPPPPTPEDIPASVVSPAPQSEEPDNYTSFIPTTGNEQSVFYAKEEELIRMLIRHGEKIMCYVEDENGEQHPLTVIECIASSLKEDELQFHDALHRRVLKEAEAHLHDEHFTAERYFIAHPDPQVSKLAVDMISERYQLSKYHSKGQKIVTDEERLYELIPRLLVDFKLSIVDEEMKHTLQALTDPAIANDPVRCAEIMKRYKELHETQSLMAQNAGDRVVLKP